MNIDNNVKDVKVSELYNIVMFHLLRKRELNTSIVLNIMLDHMSEDGKININVNGICTLLSSFDIDKIKKHDVIGAFMFLEEHQIIIKENGKFYVNGLIALNDRESDDIDLNFLEDDIEIFVETKYGGDVVPEYIDMDEE